MTDILARNNQSCYDNDDDKVLAHNNLSCDDDDNKVLAHNNLSCDDNDNEVLTQNNLNSGDNDDKFLSLLCCYTDVSELDVGSVFKMCVSVAGSL